MKALLAIFILFGTAGVALADDFDDFGEEFGPIKRVWDPLQGVNRVMFTLNDGLYRVILTPASHGYKVLVPESARTGVGRMFANIAYPKRLVSNLLQGRLGPAGIETRRFFLNSTVGLFGFKDVARERYDLYPYDEDLGQVLGAAGMGEIFPVTLPVLGPMNLRDTIGWIGDGFLDPTSYVEPWRAAFGLKLYDKVNYVSLHNGEYESVVDAAVDPYLFLRDASSQLRDRKIKE